MPREKSRYRDKRSSSRSSESSYERKKSKSKHRRRSRSRNRSEASTHKRRRSTSRSRYKRRSYSRSLSRDRYESKSRRRSTSRTRSKRDRSRSRSRSRSKSRYSKHKKSSRKRSRSSSSRSNDFFDIERPPHNLRPKHDDTEIKLEKSIKAAEAAGLTMTKIPTYEPKEVQIKEDMPTIHDRNLLAELNSDSFVQRSFVSSKKSKDGKKQSQNIVIDLDNETVKVPEGDIKVHKNDNVINFDEIPNEEALKEMWIKKLYQYRKKMLRGEI